MKQATTTAFRNECREALLKLCPAGTDVYCVIRSVARSGMSRRIDFYVIRENRPQWITSRVAAILGNPFDYDTPGMRINGCGMDMGFAAVSELAYALYGNESALKHVWL